MNVVKRVAAYRISPAVLDGTVGELLCYLAAVAVMILGFRRLGTLAVSPSEAFLGILLVLAVGLHLVCLGVLMRLLARRG